MRVFVTGATGFVGSAVVRELIEAGHQVVGLARSQAAARALVAAGAQAHDGSLEELESLRRGAAAADGVIHTAFIHDFRKFKDNCETDRRAVTALCEALAGSGRPLVVTSALGILPQGRLATEDTEPASGAASPLRAPTEAAARAAAVAGASVSLVRLAPTVHGDGDHGFVPLLVDLARRTGVSAYVGDGENRWPAVHRLDAARLFRLVLEAGAPRPVCHAVAEEGVAFRDIAGVIGRRLGLPVTALSAPEATGHFGWFAPFAAMDIPASSRRTREWLGWQPTGSGLIEDLDRPGYFAR
ncbi:SDR family oxidoreductase [Solidesulfovibrio sp.]|uniref:SDR family oxidoreductase n=1 Tax=Solidesulfovibrio sp. TaxID=2910990 RepID=UPI002635E445|nr:SDR family oxidoreductase [Solidesulfovibrio sp.]